jgi:hypothetical protein
MKDRVGQYWQLGRGDESRVDHFAPSVPYRILVVESIDKGNGRTLQRYIYFYPDGKRGGSGEDTEYADFPWEIRSERSRLG